MKIGGRKKAEKVCNDICVIPPDTDELTDVEDVDDREMGVLSGDSIKETAGTLEIHANNCEFDDLDLEFSVDNDIWAVEMSFVEYRG